MNEQPVSVTKISWRDLCPWTNIFNTLPIATSMTVLVLSLVGVVLTPAGWLLSERLCLNEEIRLGRHSTEKLFEESDQQRRAEFSKLVDLNRSPYRGLFRASEENASAVSILGNQLSGPRLVFDSMIRPFKMLFSGEWSFREYLYLLLGSLWSLLTWSFVGLCICRVAVLRLTRNERIGIDDAVDFALDKYKTAISAIGMPLLAVIALCIPAALVGLLIMLDWGAVVFGALWIIVLAISGIIAILLLGLMFAWPLIVASTATEGQNSFDAMTRSYAYVFQRPLNYLFYGMLAIFFGGICWLIVAQLTNGIVELGYWSTSWGTNLIDGDRIDVLKGVMDPVDPEALTEEALAAAEAAGSTDTSTASRQLRWARGLIGFWNGLARTLAAAFIYGLFWCMATAIYLLLRNDVDETALDEVYLVDEKRTFDLPPLRSDENGIPQVQTPRPVAESSDEDSSSSEDS